LDVGLHPDIAKNISIFIFIFFFFFIFIVFKREKKGGGVEGAPLLDRVRDAVETFSRYFICSRIARPMGWSWDFFFF